MELDALTKLVEDTLDDMKAQEVQMIDVAKKSTITERLFIATGNSTRHVKSIADNVALEAKNHDLMPLGVEGEQGSNWVLVDLGDVVVHVMLAETRAFYNLEKLWGNVPGESDGDSADTVTDRKAS